MNSTAATLEAISSSAPPEPLHRSGEFLDLIQRVVSRHSVLALVGAGSGSRAGEACRGIATELAASGNRVVIVQVDHLLQANPVPAATDCQSSSLPNVWLWPSATGAPAEFDQCPVTAFQESDWLASLRHNFDSVLLDCSTLAAAPAVAGIAAMADATVLVVQSHQTSRQQIQRDQRSLELRGVKLAGCILMQQR